MKYFYILLLVSFLSPLFSAAQTDFRPGYVTTLKGDTLHGYVKNSEWAKNPKAISFKSTQNGNNIQTYTAGSISAFGVTGHEQYERHIVQVSKDPVDIEKLSKGIDTTTITDTVFLKVIVKGPKITLYGYVDDVKQHYYVSEGIGAKPQELSYHIYGNADDAASIQYACRYRSQLQYIAQKNNINGTSLNQDIANAQYNDDDLDRIAVKLNGNTATSFSSGSAIRATFFAGAGAGYGHISLSGTGLFSATIKSSVSSSSIYPRIDAGVDLYNNKNIQRLFLRVEASFTGAQFKLTSKGDGNGLPTTGVLNFTQYSTSFSPQLIYNVYDQQAFKAFIGFGLSYNILSYNSYAFITKYSNGTPDYVNDEYPKFKHSDLSMVIKAGIAISQKIDISINFMPPASITDFSTTDANVMSIQAGVNYFFGRR